MHRLGIEDRNVCFDRWVVFLKYGLAPFLLIAFGACVTFSYADCRERDTQYETAEANGCALPQKDDIIDANSQRCMEYFNLLSYCAGNVTAMAEQAGEAGAKRVIIFGLAITAGIALLAFVACLLYFHNQLQPLRDRIAGIFRAQAERVFTGIDQQAAEQLMRQEGYGTPGP